ncbi:type VII secretion target [Mangrovihabitans endophyticus]|uniref:Excreted virulence factor EspC, type VII ESX diderm n=1 Tax=Mangrovihabitans endophyticus TaxID=1751298 RepID=A0A8J3FP46_9ACTN|nr:type VII secretion target [Mangrovihabitans endophyticus]GGK96604.1 hypothetical protein GCM10012284_33540 [Mangrovihabitans endophyticus]
MEMLAGQLDATADQLAAVGRTLPGLIPPAAAFGADSSGLPGRVGRRLHDHYGAVLAARAGEATDVAERMTDLATAVRETQRDYEATDEAVGRRIEREG